MLLTVYLYITTIKMVINTIEFVMIKTNVKHAKTLYALINNH